MAFSWTDVKNPHEVLTQSRESSVSNFARSLNATIKLSCFLRKTNKQDNNKTKTIRAQRLHPFFPCFQELVILDCAVKIFFWESVEGICNIYHIYRIVYRESVWRRKLSDDNSSPCWRLGARWEKELAKIGLSLKIQEARDIPNVCVCKTLHLYFVNSVFKFLPI